MNKRSENIMQTLGQGARATGSVGGPTAPAVYRGWGGPVAGAAIKGLAVGLPTYALSRLALKATDKDKDWDAHRTSLLAGILSGVGAGAMDYHQMGQNFADAPGGVMNGLKNLNKDPGTFMPKQSDYNGSMRGTQGGSIASGVGTGACGALGTRVRQDDPVTQILSGVRHLAKFDPPKGDREMYASSDSGGPIKPHPEMVSGKIVKEALMRLGRYLGTAQNCKMASDWNEAGGFADYSTYVPPGYQQTIASNYTASQIENDPYLAPQEKARALMHIDNASGGRPGLISTNDITRAAVGAGIGYASASLFGRVLGGLFGGLSPQTQRTMQQTGAIAGLLINTGALR